MAAGKSSKQSGVVASQVTPGMIIQISKQLYRVESSVKVAVTKGAPFIKTKLRNLNTEKMSEKNFKLDQVLEEVTLEKRNLEFLYVDGKDYVFLDIDSLDRIPVPEEVIGEAVQFVKEGIQLIGSLYGETVYDVELPQFLELMVASVDGEDDDSSSNAVKTAVLETGAKVEVPPFVEPGDIIKVDTRAQEYIQRV